ncbi:MAG: hypothetical protein ABI488_02150 [Polyangiaceae bacterium]
MTALSPNARALVQAGREGFRAPPGERERLEALLLARPNPEVGNSIRPAQLRPAGWRFVPAVALGLTLVGGAAYLALSATPSHALAPPVRAAVAAQPSALPASPAPSVDVTAAVALMPSAKAAVEPRALTSRPEDRLAQEVALLSRATGSLRSGRPADALKALDEYQRKFPAGVLSVERRAVKAQTLCTMKRVSEGRAEAAHLAPQSPAAARTKQICDAAANAMQ